MRPRADVVADTGTGRIGQQTLAGSKAVAEGRMDVRMTKLAGVLVLKPRRFVDTRGYFVEVYTESFFRQAGITAAFVQDNQSLSLRQGTIRGLHFQLPPAAQAKLVRVIRGCVHDVVVDLR